MALQYAFNCVAQTVAMAAADFRDENKVAALQQTGALPDSTGSPRGTRMADIEAAWDQGVGEGTDMSNSRGYSSFEASAMTILVPAVTGGLVTLIVGLRGRMQVFRDPENAALVGPLQSLVAGLAVLVNIVSFDILRFQVSVSVHCRPAAPHHHGGLLRPCGLTGKPCQVPLLGLAGGGPTARLTPLPGYICAGFSHTRRAPGSGSSWKTILRPTSG